MHPRSVHLLPQLQVVVSGRIKVSFYDQSAGYTDLAPVVIPARSGDVFLKRVLLLAHPLYNPPHFPLPFTIKHRAADHQSGHQLKQRASEVLVHNLHAGVRVGRGVSVIPTVGKSRVPPLSRSVSRSPRNSYFFWTPS